MRFELEDLYGRPRQARSVGHKTKRGGKFAFVTQSGRKLFIEAATEEKYPHYEWVEEGGWDYPMLMDKEWPVIEGDDEGGEFIRMLPFEVDP